MKSYRKNKRKIVNDPVYGFIHLPSEGIFDLIEHPYFQRLRRIKQLGLTYLVYPGATHTRFQHALGAMHLMTQAMETLRQKGHPISDHESEAACIAILLHDIGHGPYSHALETTIVPSLNHELLSIRFMDQLNLEFGGLLEEAQAIYSGKHPRHFLHQLVSSQLDTDRLDYLRRDSFFTGVSEGSVGSDRLIKMFNLHEDELVVEEKGIYSIEQFLIARRLMYWQVYFHKTVVAAEWMLIHILRRAREIVLDGGSVPATPALDYFLQNQASPLDWIAHSETPKEHSPLFWFALLDDSDLQVAIKTWQFHKDTVLSNLCQRLTHRNLLRLVFSADPFPESEIHQMQDRLAKTLGISRYEASYFVFSDSIAKDAYNPTGQEIRILLHHGEVKGISQVTDILDFEIFGSLERKYFLASPKEN